MEEIQHPEEPQITSETEHLSDQEVQEQKENELAEEREEHLQRMEGTPAPDTTLPAEEEPSDEGSLEEDNAS